ncbi:hypothetical protein ACJX0J_017550, partial [Zea mays]
MSISEVVYITVLMIYGVLNVDSIFISSTFYVAYYSYMTSVGMVTTLINQIM